MPVDLAKAGPWDHFLNLLNRLRDHDFRPIESIIALVKNKRSLAKRKTGQGGQVLLNTNGVNIPIEKLKKGVKQMPPMKGAKLGKPQKVKAMGEAKFTPAQVSALKDKYGKLGPGAEKNAVQMDKLAKMMSKYSKSHLSQLADMGVPMVSKVAKELMK